MSDFLKNIGPTFAASCLIAFTLVLLVDPTKMLQAIFIASFMFIALRSTWGIARQTYETK